VQKYLEYQDSGGRALLALLTDDAVLISDG
jgi:hypothetical protein